MEPAEHIGWFCVTLNEISLTKINKLMAKGFAHNEIHDVSKAVGGHTEIELRELHADNKDAESMDSENITLVFQDKVGNKRICKLNVDEFDDVLRSAGFRLERH